jgi:hypothetical protein
VGGRTRHDKADYTKFKDQMSETVSLYHAKRGQDEPGALDPHCEGGLVTLQVRQWSSREAAAAAGTPRGWVPGWMCGHARQPRHFPSRGKGQA